VWDYILSMEDLNPEQLLSSDLDTENLSRDTVLPENAHLDEQGRVLVPRELTRSEKRMHALYEKKFSRNITTYEVYGHIS
jgi:hypothetical protein